MSSISVIIPSYNRAELIGETLDSILGQSCPADEIIIVDDGSSDRTGDVVLQVLKKWEIQAGKLKPEIKIIRQNNKGPASARNLGFAASTGEYIHFFDSDDIALPNKQEVQMELLQKSGADIAYGPWIKGRFLKNNFIPENHVLQQRGLPRGDLIRALLTNWSIVSHACLFRRSIVEKSGGFPEHLFVGEDQLMFLNCLLAGAKIVHSPGTLELYRIGDVGKITAPGGDLKRYALHWAWFLLAADDCCRLNGIYPRNWFGFRQRVWEALDDLRQYGIVDEELLLRLQEIHGEKTSAFLYALQREAGRKWLGMKFRFTGSRADACFCAGPIETQQVELISQMGLKFSSPQ